MLLGRHSIRTQCLAVQASRWHPTAPVTGPQPTAQGPAGFSCRAGRVYIMEALQGLNAQTSTLSLTTCLSVEKQFKVALETKRVIFLVKMKAVNFKPTA